MYFDLMADCVESREVCACRLSIYPQDEPQGEYLHMRRCAATRLAASDVCSQTPSHLRTLKSRTPPADAVRPDVRFFRRCTGGRGPIRLFRGEALRDCQMTIGMRPSRSPSSMGGHGDRHQRTRDRSERPRPRIQDCLRTIRADIRETRRNRVTLVMAASVAEQDVLAAAAWRPTTASSCIRRPRRRHIRAASAFS